MPDTPTTRLALIKPLTSDNKQVATLNTNSDKIDAAVGMQWVTDGALPAVQFHGAVFKELTSNRQFILKNDGLGGFTKVEITSLGQGTINHYTKAPSPSIAGNTVTAPANGWSTIAGSGVSWTSDRVGTIFIRVTCDVTPHSGAASVKFRLSGQTTSETGSMFPPANRQAQQITFTRDVGVGAVSMSVDFYNFTASGASLLNEIKYYVDTNVVLT